MINSSPLFARMVFHGCQSVMLLRTLWPIWYFPAGQAVFPKVCIPFPGLRFPHRRNMDTSSTQYFSLDHYVVVMLSHGNITHVLLGMMVIGMEMAKVKP